MPLSPVLYGKEGVLPEFSPVGVFAHRPALGRKPEFAVEAKILRSRIPARSRQPLRALARVWVDPAHGATSWPVPGYCHRGRLRRPARRRHRSPGQDPDPKCCAPWLALRCAGRSRAPGATGGARGCHRHGYAAAADAIWRWPVLRRSGGTDAADRGSGRNPSPTTSRVPTPRRAGSGSYGYSGGGAGEDTPVFPGLLRARNCWPGDCLGSGVEGGWLRGVSGEAGDDLLGDLAELDVAVLGG